MDKKTPDLAKINDLAVDALTDDELEAAAGGQDVAATSSCQCCVAGATHIHKQPAFGTVER